MCMYSHINTIIYFLFNDPAPPEIYTLSLHDALPIYPLSRKPIEHPLDVGVRSINALLTVGRALIERTPDRKSTRLNSSHSQISYAVFCLKKKNLKNWEIQSSSCKVQAATIKCH